MKEFELILWKRVSLYNERVRVNRVKESELIERKSMSDRVKECELTERKSVS